MSGITESNNHNAGGGSFDLLRRATQAMMSSRSVAPDDDNSDQIGFDTPRSGIATPQPDPQDKRHPGILSYFNQVRPASIRRLFSGTSTSAEETPNTTFAAPAGSSPTGEEKLKTAGAMALPPSPAESNSRSQSNGSEPPLLPHERVRLPAEKLGLGSGALHPYPTPPTSKCSSLRSANASDLGRRTAGQIFHKKSSSDVQGISRRRGSICAPLTGVITPSSVTASHFSNPTSRKASTTPSSRRHSQSLSTSGRDRDSTASQALACVEPLKKLTLSGDAKSGQSTPTRALSTARPSRVEHNDDGPKEHGNGIDRVATVTPTPPGAKAPAAKGKLTIKITEGRKLRKSKDPYVVAVFQRSELISGGPRVVEDEGEAPTPPPFAAGGILGGALGGVPIQRSGSDTGRPMAIPMRSRQSSNTSVTDYNTFRARSSRKSFTNPKWDAEATFDVVDGDLLVDISVYDHGANGEEFLGHVDFRASITEDGRVRGWFPLQGHADTMVENTPSGEIFVEAIYQADGQRHFGPEDFQILRLIGKGTFGQVYQVRKKDSKRIYAMKVLSKKVIVQKKEVAHTVGERNILVRTATTDSPFIVGLKFSFQTPSDLYLVTDYMSGGELFWHLQKEGRFDEQRARFYIAELILAIQHLHKNDIVYRDLKPENILLDANGHIALCDFGLSKANLTKNDTTNTFCGTTEYLAPEVLLDEAGYTKMVDFWSLGVLVFEMCCGWSPFYAEDTQQMYKNIAFGKVRFPKDTLSPDGRNFVKGLLNRNPKHRLGATKDAEELKEHAFFKEINWETLSRKEITPPFKPKLKSETDVSYFDPEFTNALATNGSLNERAAALARGFATSTPLSPSVQANFQGFTFVDESALEDHMRDRFEDKDELMDDVDRPREDQDWDDIDDIDPRRGNRMSGIVRTSINDEHMVGGSHFDM